LQIHVQLTGDNITHIAPHRIEYKRLSFLPLFTSTKYKSIGTGTTINSANTPNPYRISPVQSATAAIAAGPRNDADLSVMLNRLKNRASWPCRANEGVE
jgi:hypothetical protein